MLTFSQLQESQSKIGDMCVWPYLSPPSVAIRTSSGWVCIENGVVLHVKQYELFLKETFHYIGNIKDVCNHLNIPVPEEFLEC